MPRLTKVSTDQPSSEIRSEFETYLKERGNVPNMFRTAAHRPEIMKTMSLRPELMEGIMRLQDKISAKTIGLPRGAKAAADSRPLVAAAPAAV